MEMPTTEAIAILMIVTGKNGRTHVVSPAIIFEPVTMQNMSAPQQMLIKLPMDRNSTTLPLKRLWYFVARPDRYARIGKERINPPVGPTRH